MGDRARALGGTDGVVFVSVNEDTTTGRDGCGGLGMLRPGIEYA